MSDASLSLKVAWVRAMASMERVEEAMRREVFRDAALADLEAPRAERESLLEIATRIDTCYRCDETQLSPEWLADLLRKALAPAQEMEAPAWSKAAPKEQHGPHADYYFYREVSDAQGAPVQAYASGGRMCFMFIGNNNAYYAEDLEGEFSGPLTPTTGGEVAEFSEWMQGVTHACLKALGLPYGARPESTKTIMETVIIPAIRALTPRQW